MSNLPILLFDWDGVLVDSNAWKWGGAWEEVFKDEPALLTLMKDVLSKDIDKKMTRAELVEVLFKRAAERGIHPMKLPPDYIYEYGKAVRAGISRIGLFSGVESVLEALKKRGYKMYVISMSAQEDLEYLAHFLKVDEYFCALHGTPGSKEQHVESIHEQEVSRRYVVIGDGEGDLHLAKKFGHEFIGVINRWNEWDHVDYINYKVKNIPQLFEVLDYINVPHGKA